MNTMQQVFSVHSVPETNLTSSFFSSQLEYALHLFLFPVSLQRVSPVQLVFEMSYNPFEFVKTMVMPAFFVILRELKTQN